MMHGASLRVLNDAYSSGKNIRAKTVTTVDKINKLSREYLQKEVRQNEMKKEAKLEIF